MNGDFLKHFATYYSIYKYVAPGSKTLEEIKAFLESEFLFGCTCTES